FLTHPSFYIVLVLFLLLLHPQPRTTLFPYTTLFRSKEKSAIQPMFTIELANGYYGYLPTPAHHELGGYETWRARSSFLEVHASEDRKSTRLNSSHVSISYAVFCLKKKKEMQSTLVNG